MSFELVPLKPDQHTVSFVPRLSLELPFFNLTPKRHKIPKVIKYEGRDDEGRPIRWEVYQDTSDEIGAPAVEAHEVWYLLVKPSIDASRRPDGTIPDIIPLGGVRESLRRVGWTAGGHQGRELIKALTQISFAGCVADLWIPTGEEDSEGKKRFLQIKGRFSRMSVYAIGEHHLTEEELSQTKFAFDLSDVIYIRLDPLEAKLQQLQDRRILDNQYLFSVTPAARRWYELMAAKIFGVVTNSGEFCEIRYSWYVEHHHTLKRQYERFRVVEQMNRVVRDHVESGYLNRVEYRVVKEPDQEIDYIVRYYPGPGAKQSNARIQQFIRDKKRLRTLRHNSFSPLRHNIAASMQLATPRALSIATSIHYELASRLILEFRISPSKAIALVFSQANAVKRQLEAWPHREGKPRNPAGWMIQAIENNYDLPKSYLAGKQEEAAQAVREAERRAIRNCPFCDAKGFRRIDSNTVRQCTHNPSLENIAPPNAQNSTQPSDFSENEIGPAHESIVP